MGRHNAYRSEQQLQNTTNWKIWKYTNIDKFRVNYSKSYKHPCIQENSRKTKIGIERARLYPFFLNNGCITICHLYLFVPVFPFLILYDEVYIWCGLFLFNFQNIDFHPCQFIENFNSDNFLNIQCVLYRFRYIQSSIFVYSASLCKKDIHLSKTDAVYSQYEILDGKIIIFWLGLSN